MSHYYDAPIRIQTPWHHKVHADRTRNMTATMISDKFFAGYDPKTGKKFTFRFAKKEGIVLVIKCAACQKKLWKYEKIGHGEVLRCHKHRITRWFWAQKENDDIICNCGNKIGIDKGKHIKMIAKAFTYTGTKKNA